MACPAKHPARDRSSDKAPALRPPRGGPSWNWAYLQRRHGGPRPAKAWLEAKRRELEAETGVPWGYDTVGLRVQFNPYPDFTQNRPTPVQDADLAQRAVEWLVAHGHRRGNTAAGYCALAEGLGVDLATAVGLGITLVRQHRAVININRRGHPISLYVP